MTFINRYNQYQIFVITRIESETVDKEGYFLNQRLKKSIALYYRQLFPIEETSDSRFILLTTYPDDQSSNISFSFRNIHSVKSNAFGVPMSRMNDSGLEFSNGAYLIKNAISDTISNSISELYVKENVGVIGYKDNDSTIWRLK